MKRKVILILILCMCANSLLFGCSRQKMIDNEKLNVLFQNNEDVFVAVANDLWPLELDYLNFNLKDNAVVVRDSDNNKFKMSNQYKTDLLNCLKKMEQFLNDNYNLTKFSLRIHVRKLDGVTKVIEFNFYDAKNKMDSGIVYTTEQLDGGNYFKLKDDWYLYSYGLV